MEKPIPLHKALRNLEKAYSQKVAALDDAEYEIGRLKARLAATEQQVKDLVQNK